MSPQNPTSRAADLDFEEDSFRAYAKVVQESGAFQISEIWLLGPMLQLELLCQLGDTVQQAQEGAESGDGQKGRPDSESD